MNHSRKGELEGPAALFLIIFLGGALVVIIAAGMWIFPTYSVWSQEKAGQAERAKAEGNRQIVVLEAQAKMDAAKLLAQAEVERAKGVAEANRIIGVSLQGNEVYLHYLWINNLHEGRNDVIYVPTEAGIPVMEAGRSVNKSPRVER